MRLINKELCNVQTCLFAFKIPIDGKTWDREGEKVYWRIF